jgi:prepilin-type N-terminal cleavage/methylation domain-containing protein
MNNVPTRMTEKPGPTYNLQSAICNYKAFTLIELLIVVAILGIMAAIVLPEFQSQTQKAKEAAAKDNLRILREAIERYAAAHNDVAPGYASDNPNSTPNIFAFNAQMVLNKTYLSGYVKNPFSGIIYIRVLTNAQTLTEATAAAIPTGSFGWIYHPATKTIKLNWPGVDSEGKKYFDY